MDHYSILLSHIADEDDMRYVAEFKNRFADIVTGIKPEYEDSDPLDLDDTQVTVVLIGEHTWRSAQIDQQLYKSLTPVPRGILAIILPTYDYPGLSKRGAHGEEHLHATTPRDSRYWAHNIPRRVVENIQSGYITVRPWSEKAKDVEEWIHEAFLASTKFKPEGIDRMPMMQDDHSELGWKSEKAPANEGGTFESRVNLVG